VAIRPAAPTGEEARRIWDLQLVCDPIVPRLIRENVSMITDHDVLIAEIDGIHVGFCVSMTSARAQDPLFIQIVGVAPSARRRGIGLALMMAAAQQAPERHIALATQDSNTAARGMNDRFAKLTRATIRRVPLGALPDHHLGINRGLGYRVWLIERP
jgi:GNAT superfamily N-acetyltransferase